MTALAGRRRLFTARAAALVVSSLVLALVLTVVGVRTLATSTIGAEVTSGGPASLRLPFTSTAFIGNVDDEGVLRSAAMLALDPDGVGGSVVSIDASADIASNRSTEVMPLSDGLSTGGVDVFRLDAESITGATFDLVSVLTVDDLTALLDPIGAVTVDLPVSVSDDHSGRSVAAGVSTLEPSDIAWVLTAHVNGVPSSALAPARAAVWDAVAASIGDGVASLEGVFVREELTPQAVPATITSFWRRLIAGPVGHRALQVEPLAPGRAPDGVDASFHDWSETLMVSAHIAPARVAAPLDAATIRIVVPFSDGDGEQGDLTVTDLAVTAVDRAVLAGLNVVSVATLESGIASGPPDVTQIWTGDAERVADAAASFAILFGDVSASVGDYSVDGVDVVVILGRSFIDDLDRDIRPSIEDSVFDQTQ